MRPARSHSARLITSEHPVSAVVDKSKYLFGFAYLRHRINFWGPPELAAGGGPNLGLWLSNQRHLCRAAPKPFE